MCMECSLSLLASKVRLFFISTQNYTINTTCLLGMLQQKVLFRSFGKHWQMTFCQLVDISFKVQAACNSNTSNTLITITYRYKLMMNYNFTKNCKHFAQLSVLSFRQSALLMINKLTNTQLEWTTSRQYKKCFFIISLVNIFMEKAIKVSCRPTITYIPGQQNCLQNALDAI